MTYSEAIEIMRHAQKKGVRHATLTMALLLSQFSFPLEKKFQIMDRAIADAEDAGGSVWALGYFMEPFRAAESDYHKGTPPKKGTLTKVSDILGIKNG